MSVSQVRQPEDLYDQITILIGSAIRLLCGEAGVFVVSEEVFDPQSNAEYTVYQLGESSLPVLLAQAREGVQPSAACPLMASRLPAEIAADLLRDGDGNGDWGRDEDGQIAIERCVLLIQDYAGILGTLHYLRPAGAYSCFERHTESGSALSLFIAHLAAGLRFALRSQALAKEQGRLAAIFEHSAEGILTVDREQRIIDFNPAMEHLTGWQESEVLGRLYYEVLRPRDRLGNEITVEDLPIVQAFVGQRIVNREMVLVARDGQCFDASVTASCVRGASGEPTNGILNVRDITREREQEEQRSTFISVISHELQTPIAIIKGYASTLARTDAVLEPEALRARLLAVEEEADRLNKLVGNLLYASRIQAGGLQMEIAPLDLARLVQGVVQRQRARTPGFPVVVDIPPNLPTVMADRDRIEEVLQNLLDNAIKYSPQRRTVTVACHATGDEVIVSVSDSGIGISLRDQEEIFQRFQRIRNSQTQIVPGTGLGLYICRAIVEAHGGRIWVESTLHHGSTFSFSLPRVEKARLPMVVF